MPDFNPSLHARDREGKFRAMLMGLKNGESVKLPSGVTVTRTSTGGKYRVKGRTGSLATGPKPSWNKQGHVHIEASNIDAAVHWALHTHDTHPEHSKGLQTAQKVAQDRHRRLHNEQVSRDEMSTRSSKDGTDDFKSQGAKANTGSLTGAIGSLSDAELARNERTWTSAPNSANRTHVLAAIQGEKQKRSPMSTRSPKDGTSDTAVERSKSNTSGERVLGSDAAVAVGRFNEGGTEGYKASGWPGAKLRKKRETAVEDQRKWLEHRHRDFAKGDLPTAKDLKYLSDDQIKQLVDRVIPQERGAVGDPSAGALVADVAREANRRATRRRNEGPLPGSKMSRRTGHDLLTEGFEDLVAEVELHERLTEAVEARKAAQGGSAFAQARALETELREQLARLEERSSTGYHFDPRLHPRNRLGAFTDVLAKLKSSGRGSDAALPGGITVGRAHGRFHVHTPDGKRIEATHSPERAASSALTAFDASHGRGGWDPMPSVTTARIATHDAGRRVKALAQTKDRGMSGAKVWKGDAVEGMRKIVASKQAHEIDGYLVDMQSANAMLKVYDALNADNKVKFGKVPIPKLAKFAWSRMR